MHPKFADRIASVLSKVQASKPKPEAAKWWTERFGHITKEEYDDVVAAMNRRAGKR